MTLPPDRDSPEYLSYLRDKIEEEEDCLKVLQDKQRVTSMEEQLAQLHLKSSELMMKTSSVSGFTDLVYLYPLPDSSN